MKRYRWLIDKDGKTTNKPIDKDNHFVDALRYVALNRFKPRAKYTVV